MDFKDKNIRINSPISKRVLFILGLDENKLYEITKDEFLARNIELKNFPSHLQNQRYEQFNAKRLKFINDAKKLRNEIISDNKKEIKVISKNNNDSIIIDEYLTYRKEEKPYSVINQQIKSMIQYEINQQENRRKNYEKHLGIEENLKKIQEEKKEKDELKKLNNENLLEIIEKNQYEKSLQFNKKQKEIIQKEEERLKRLELKKLEDLEESKRIADERNERARKVLDKNQLLYDTKMKKLLELEKRLKKKDYEIIEEVEPWKKEEEGERNRQKNFMKNLQNELDSKNKLELNNETDLKLLKMKEIKEDIMKNKIEKLSEKMKENEERSLECMKKNAELEEIRIKKILERGYKSEKKVKKNKKLKAIESKKKFLYLKLIRQDNMNNLKTLENKREFEREKMISKILEKDRRILEFKDNKKKISEGMKFMSKEMNIKKDILLKKAHFLINSGKYRNSKDIISQVFNDE